MRTVDEINLSKDDGTSLRSKEFLFLHHVNNFSHKSLHVMLHANLNLIRPLENGFREKKKRNLNSCLMLIVITLKGGLLVRKVMFFTSLNQYGNPLKCIKDNG